MARGRRLGRQLSRVWGSRVQKLTREEHVDELMLLNLSEQFFENTDAVAWLRGLMLDNPHPQPPRRLPASSTPPPGTTPATGSARCRCPCT